MLAISMKKYLEVQHGSKLAWIYTCMETVVMIRYGIELVDR